MKSRIKCPACLYDTIPIAPIGRFNTNQCLGCGGQFTWPQPSDEQLAEIYTGEYYKPWDSVAGTSRDAKKVLFREYIKTHGIKIDGMRVVDFGAALGHMMEVVRDLGGECYGVEINSSGVSKLREQFGLDRVCEGIAESPSFPTLLKNGDGEFDIVSMFDYIEHVRTPIGALQTAFRLLRPGGIVIGTTPNIESVSCKIMGRSWPHFKEEHLFYHSAVSLSAAGTAAGLRLVGCSPNKKKLPMGYIAGVAHQYKNPFLNRLVGVAGVIKCPMSLPSGEWFFVYKKPIATK